LNDYSEDKNIETDGMIEETEHKENDYLFTSTSGEHKNRSLGQSLKMAFAGLTHVVWTQKHVRTQLLIIILVLMLCYALRLSVINVLFVISAIVLVIIAELFNTAIEVVVNMITMKYDPRAKIAKDVAAAGVLMASFYSIFVGFGIFLGNIDIVKSIGDFSLVKWGIDPPSPIVVLVLAFSVLTLIVILGKAKKNHGSILKGGAISAHTAVAFMLFVAIAIYSKLHLPVTIMALLLALLVAQSRVEGRIHTVREVIWGALVAIILMALLMLFPSSAKANSYDENFLSCPSNICGVINCMLPSENLAEMGIILPTPPTPIASYVPAVRSGNLLYISGQLPLVDGAIPEQYIGLVNNDTAPIAAMAATQAVINALSIIENEVGVDCVKRIVRLNGYVNSDHEFTLQPMVINGASDFLVRIFGEAGKHTRVAVSAPSLPLGSVVEIDLIVELYESCQK